MKHALWAMLWVFSLMGCAASPAERDARSATRDFFAGRYEQAQARLAPLADKPDENYVLNNLRLGSAALARHDLAQAEAAFWRAYEVINAGGVNEGGRAWGAVLFDEKIKIYKGEPYERAMANFYLGLVYYIQHDWDNARAAFENALFKLRDYAQTPKKGEENHYQELESNFALASVMLGRCWQHLGREDLAEAEFARARRMNPALEALADPATHRRGNVLLVVDCGYGPRKATDFDGSIVGFSPTPAQEGPMPLPRISVNGQAIDVADANAPTIDTLAMAQQRPWQSIDTIRTVKSAVGTGLIAGGAIAGVSGASRHSEETLAVGAGLIAAGLLLKATSQADLRQWEMLPRTVFVVPLDLPAGSHELTIDFPDVHGLRQTWRGLIAPASGPATYYVRMMRWNPGPFEFPSK